MAERASAPGCGRANDLVAFLYDEVNEYETRDFELHLQNCFECKSEFLEFRQIRQSVVAWRDESLSVIPSSVVGSNLLQFRPGSDRFRKRTDRQLPRSESSLLSHLYG